MVLLIPDEALMSKWLPAVRWGSLEVDSSARGLSHSPRSWLASADYYRFPHVLHFHSVASFLVKLQHSSPRRPSEDMRKQTLAVYEQLLAHILSRPLLHLLFIKSKVKRGAVLVEVAS